MLWVEHQEGRGFLGDRGPACCQWLPGLLALQAMLRGPGQESGALAFIYQAGSLEEWPLSRGSSIQNVSGQINYHPAGLDTVAMVTSRQRGQGPLVPQTWVPD